MSAINESRCAAPIAEDDAVMQLAMPDTLIAVAAVPASLGTTSSASGGVVDPVTAGFFQFTAAQLAAAPPLEPVLEQCVRSSNFSKRHSPFQYCGLRAKIWPQLRLLIQCPNPPRRPPSLRLTRTALLQRRTTVFLYIYIYIYGATLMRFTWTSVTERGILFSILV